MSSPEFSIQHKAPWNDDRREPSTDFAWSEVEQSFSDDDPSINPVEARARQQAAVVLRRFFERAGFDRNGNPVGAEELGLRFAALAAELRWYPKNDARAVAGLIGVPFRTLHWWRQKWSELYGLRQKKRPPEFETPGGDMNGKAKRGNTLTLEPTCATEDGEVGE